MQTRNKRKLERDPNPLQTLTQTKRAKTKPQRIPEPVRSRSPPATPSNNDDSLKEKLNKLYEDIKSVPNYSAKIAEFLRQDATHGPFQRIKRKTFPRRRIIARYPFEYFMADLIEYPRTKVINRGYVYILIVIDCFSRRVWSYSMKEKSAQWSADAFSNIFKSFDEFPKNIITDGGLEFFNSAVKKVFDSYGINHFKCPTKTTWKASMAERAIQTIKSRLEKYFAKTKQRIWINVIEQIVKNYNETPHRSIGMAPLAVTDENRDEVYKRLYPNRSITIVCKFKAGDRVRKKLEKTIYEKGYTKKWSDEIFVIEESRQSQGVCWYKLLDLNGASQPGVWYYYNLILVARNDSKSGDDKHQENKPN